jgi:hypothetical protein
MTTLTPDQRGLALTVAEELTAILTDNPSLDLETRIEHCCSYAAVFVHDITVDELVALLSIAGIDVDDLLANSIVKSYVTWYYDAGVLNFPEHEGKI